mmetsp:Transcript_1405/g.3269  ORF Transcript_1405/g.3269 Transcript_1405/m.3269 type:complete len:203 (+) Transcript_1405:363-971(+)
MAASAYARVMADTAGLGRTEVARSRRNRLTPARNSASCAASFSMGPHGTSGALGLPPGVCSVAYMCLRSSVRPKRSHSWRTAHCHVAGFFSPGNSGRVCRAWVWLIHFSGHAALCAGSTSRLHMVRSISRVTALSPSFFSGTFSQLPTCSSCSISCSSTAASAYMGSSAKSDLGGAGTDLHSSASMELDTSTSFSGGLRRSK